jgi:hypothetical protein
MTRILDRASRIFVWMMFPVAMWVAASQPLFGWRL